MSNSPSGAAHRAHHAAEGSAGVDATVCNRVCLDGIHLSWLFGTVITFSIKTFEDGQSPVIRCQVLLDHCDTQSSELSWLCCEVDLAAQ